MFRGKGVKGEKTFLRSIFMKLVSLSDKVPFKTAVALGFFDGIHKGHQAIINKALENKDASSAVFTFNQSPLLFLNGQAPARITTNNQKYELLSNLGIEVLLSVNFEEVMDLTPQEFIREILINKLNASQLYCGFNFTFGKGGSADAEDLKTLCGKYGIKVEIIPPVFQEGMIISSTIIRKTLKEGNVELANQMLGHLFSIKSAVVHGNKIGRTINTPTINQEFPNDFIIPKFGVYASLVRFDDVFTYGITNIGIKPTVGSSIPLAETFMPMYKGDDIYGKVVEVSLIKFIRPEIKFDDLNSLKKQIIFDVNRSKKIFEKKEYDYFNLTEKTRIIV